MHKFSSRGSARENQENNTAQRQSNTDNQHIHITRNARFQIMQDKLSMTYNDAVQTIKQAILDSQWRATQHINEEQLALYYGIGKFISQHTRTGAWGTNAIETISRQLSAELPGLKGYSATNLRLMRLFYEAWSALFNSSATADELREHNSSATAGESQQLDAEAIVTNSISKKNHPFLENEMTWNDFFALGFSLHTEILSKTSTIEERAFYVHNAALYR
jgi:hypothetical protein